MRGSVLTACCVMAIALVTEDSRAQEEALTTRNFHVTVASSHRAGLQPLAADLETFHAYYDSVIGNMAGLAESSPRLAVRALDGLAGLESLARDVPDLKPGAGIYPGPLQSPVRLLVAVDAGGLLGPSDQTALFHAVAHLCHRALLYDDGTPGSWWVREGLASYLAQTPLGRDGQFAHGDVRRSSGYIADISSFGRVSLSLASAEQPRKSLHAARAAFRRGLHVRLVDLLDQPGDEPWPDAVSRDQAAVQSWVLVHFLLHGPEKDLRGRLARYLDLDRQGGGGAEAFRRVVSGDLDRLEPLIFKHVKRMD